MTTPILETRGLIRRFTTESTLFTPRKILTAVGGVDLSLAQGETLGIAGESGCGKSTLARLIMGLIPPSNGDVLYKGTSLSRMTDSELTLFRRGVQIVFQDPFSSLNPRMRVGEIIGEPLAIHKIASGNERKERVLDIMQRVGLTADQINRYPHEFSGGQRQRIGIARALAVGPQVVVADEPVSALDISIQAQIINLLRELKLEYGLSFLLIAHDLSVVRHISDRIAIMYLGKIVEIGHRDAIFENFMHPYTEALISAIPKVGKSNKRERILLTGDVPSPLAIPDGCPFNTRCRYAQERCRKEPPTLEEKVEGHLAACHFIL